MAYDIHFLVDYPQHVSAVARWIFEEWQDSIAERSVEEVQKRVQDCLNRDRLPLALVALEEGEPVGTASLYPHDLPVRPQLSPWLAAVYVPLPRRGRGIGTRLVSAAEEAARNIGIEQLYLFTPDQEHFYQRLGWETLEYTYFHREQIVVMCKRL